MSGKISIVLIVYTLVVTGLWGAIPAFEGVAERINTAVQSPVVAVRTPWLTQLARWIDVGGASWGMTSLALLTLILLMVFRRWRHLLVFLGAITVMEIVGEIIYKASSRPRPFGINDIGSWGGYSLPSPPTAFLAATLIGIAYTLVVPGRPRFAAKLAAAGILVVFGLARLYLGIDHPSDVVFGLVLGVAFPLIAFRTFVPNEVFPVVYRRGNRAHLDVGGRRGQAIRQAVRDQLGLTVAEVKPVGLAGSGGSTPLRLLLEREDGSRGVAFAKLYAKNHVRADRWYKLWRTILYGALEDEASFQSVRRFVQFEDYTLRLLRDAGIPTAAPMGIVEITPGREYMLVTEFLEGATEIGDPAVTVDEHIVDEGLQLVRRLWDAGLAHRDIKPANLMVRDGTLYLIDAFFVQVRPSPWREAVDLANMMLVLAVRSDPDLVYQRALAFFSPDELAEAFAAARGVASPTQLRVALKKDGRDLVARFRSLAPQRRPIRIQRWSVKRVGLAAGVLAAVAFTSWRDTAVFFPYRDLEVFGSLSCEPGDTMILMAQAVPEATQLPCVATLPAGWAVGETVVGQGHASFWLNSDRAGHHAVQVVLRPAWACTVSGMVEQAADEPPARTFERQPLVPLTDRLYRFHGGCVSYRFQFAPTADVTQVFDVDAALSFVPRAELVAAVRERTHLSLCGAGAAPCRG